MNKLNLNITVCPRQNRATRNTHGVPPKVKVITDCLISLSDGTHIAQKTRGGYWTADDVRKEFKKNPKSFDSLTDPETVLMISRAA